MKVSPVKTEDQQAGRQTRATNFSATKNMFNGKQRQSSNKKRRKRMLSVHHHEQIKQIF